jgi:hypothetical protein
MNAAIAFVLQRTRSAWAPLKTIFEVVLTLSFNMLSKKLDRMTSNPKDNEIEEPITTVVTFSTSSGPNCAFPQMLNAQRKSTKTKRIRTHPRIMPLSNLNIL